MLFTASGSHIGGATMALMHLMLGLPSQGVRPILLSTRPLPRFRFIYERLRERGVELVFFSGSKGGPWFWLRLFFEALRVIRRRGVGLVHCHGTKEALVVGLAARLLGRRMVYTVEGDPLLEIRYAGGGYSLLTRLVLSVAWVLGLRLADVVVGCSRWMARHLARYGVEAYSAPNPIDVERFRREPASLDSMRVVSVARLERVKGLETLVKAAAEVSRRIPDAKFIIVGEGSLKERLRRLAERLGIDDKVEFTEFRPDAERVVAGSAVAVLPSLYEPFGMAAAEALAAGKPVIAARTGGLQEIVRDGVDGFLFDPGDHRGLAERLLRLLSDRGLRERMAWNAYRDALRFSPEEVAKTYVEIYRMALGRRRT